MKKNVVIKLVKEAYFPPETLPSRLRDRRYGWGGKKLRKRYRRCRGGGTGYSKMLGLQEGCKGRAVKKFQRWLQTALDLDWQVKPGAYHEKPNIRSERTGRFDGLFGPVTKMALHEFRAVNDLSKSAGPKVDEHVAALIAQSAAYVEKLKKGKAHLAGFTPELRGFENSAPAAKAAASAERDAAVKRAFEPTTGPATMGGRTERPKRIPRTRHEDLDL